MVDTELFKKLRYEQGLSQRALAARMGVSTRTVHATEHGLWQSGPSMRLKFACALGVPLIELFPYKPNKSEAGRPVS